jgi:hypothetical protein
MIGSMERRIAAIGWLMALVLPIATTLAPPARADAAAPSLWCDDGYYLRTFSPGLTGTPHDFTETVTGVFADCSSPATGGDPTVNGVATFRGSGTGTGSCDDDGTMNETWNVEWANGRSSTISISTTILITGNKTSTLSTGTVTAGEFLGAKSVGIPMAAIDDRACGTSQGMAAVVDVISTLVFL